MKCWSLLYDVAGIRVCHEVSPGDIERGHEQETLSGDKPGTSFPGLNIQHSEPILGGNIVRTVQLVQDAINLIVGTVDVQDQDVFLADTGDLSRKYSFV